MALIETSALDSSNVSLAFECIIKGKCNGNYPNCNSEQKFTNNNWRKCRQRKKNKLKCQANLCSLRLLGSSCPALSPRNKKRKRAAVEYIRI